MNKFVLIDGNSLLNRAFYATPVFTTQSGTPTNAIFGFIKLLLKIKDDINPDYLAVAFDLPAPTFRHLKYKEYKATRKPMPDELAAQVDPLKKLLRVMNIAICEQAGLEADDIVGTLSRMFDVHSYIYTGDRDSYQLVDEKTDVYFTKRGVSDLLKLNVDNFKEITGLMPKQIIDLKALMGDKSDNIPGVPGIGEKTALELLAKYGSLDGVIGHVDELKGAVREKIRNNIEIAKLSYELATIDRNCDLPVQLENCVMPQKFNVETKKLFSELEFKSLLSLNIFAEDNGGHAEISLPEKIVCKNYETLCNDFEKGGRFAVVYNEVAAHVYYNEKEYVFELAQNLLSDGLNYNEFYEIIKLIFGKPENTVIVHDFKTLMHKLREEGVECGCQFEDLALVIYLSDFAIANFSLKDLIEYYCLDFEYCAFALNNIYELNLEALKKDKGYEIYQNIEKPLLKVLYNMEREGVKISKEELEILSVRFNELINESTAKIYEQCGVEFNINSPTQLGEVLFNRLGLKAGKKSKNGKFSTSADILEKLADDSPVVKEVLKYRLYQKLNSTYIEGMKPQLDKNSIVHTTFKQTITATGRLSSVNPNLQNIPIREEEGRELRKMFVPKEGNVFIDADYSQIELRLLAHFSRCAELIEAYKTGQDIHALTASQVFDVELENVTPQMRRAAKAVNFGIIYGISDYGLAKNLNIPAKTAKEYIEKYFARYSSVKNYMESNVEFAREHGYVATLTGRKRVILEIKSPNYNLRQFGERAAMNMPLQGSSADIIKIAMINVEQALKAADLEAKLILQVHDELVLDCPEKEKEIAADILKREMENAVSLLVPLTVDVNIGQNWYEAK